MANKKSVLQNHILKLDVKSSQKTLAKDFGVSIADLEAACLGDESAVEKIGEFGRQGKFASEYAPKLANALKEGIKGTVAVNQATSDVLVEAAKGSIQIDKAGSKALLANQRLNHDRKEVSQAYDAAKSVEDKRHEYAIEYINLKSHYDLYLMGIDEDYRLAQEAYRPDFKQIQENERIKGQRINALLQHGTDAPLHLLPGKDYETTNFNEVGGVLETVKGFLSNIRSGLGW